MTEPVWGRLLVTGSTDWPAVGRKAQNKETAGRTNLEAPQLVRSVLGRRFTKVITSSSAAHQICLEVDGSAFLFGRNDHGQLGTGNTETLWEPTSIRDPAVYKNVPKALLEGVIDAATGRHHTLLVAKNGELYAAGHNFIGQCGREDLQDVHTFKQVALPAGLKASSVAAGINFSLVLTENGKVFAFGSPEKGQLGNGKTGEYVHNSRVNFTEVPHPTLIKTLDDKTIVQIACGGQHSAALDSEGYVWVWGHNGYGRLGTGTTADTLLPKAVPQFTHPNRGLRASKIACGTSATLFLDENSKMFYICGKWKNTGDGSSGQPWTTPRIFPDIQGYHMKHMAAGASAVFCITEDSGDPVAICTGQACAYGELGLGVGAVKSATKPVRVHSLDNLDIISVSCGLGSSFFLVRPPAEGGRKIPITKPKTAEPEYNPFAPPPAAEESKAPSSPVSPQQANLDGSLTDKAAFEALEKFPAILEVSDNCLVCHSDESEDPVLECEVCERGFHTSCLDPPLESVPEDEWICPPCKGEAMPEQKNSKKRKAEASTKPGKKKK